MRKTLVPIAIAALLGSGTRVAADCGSVPFVMPGEIISVELRSAVKSATGVIDSGETQESKELKVDPTTVTVFEPGQRAIILWNGEEQRLLLSTDQSSSQASHILEVIPMPSEPTVRLGEFETFHRAQELLVRKNMWAYAHPGKDAGEIPIPASKVRVTFHQQMGAHDLAVAEVSDAAAFRSFVQGHLKMRYGVENAPIRREFVQMIDTYIQSGHRWFAFDVIRLTDKTQSREPIEYVFKSDRIFYPMRISTLEAGETNVELLVVAPAGDRTFEGLPAEQIRREAPVPATASEIEALDATWKGFFAPGDDLVLHRWSITGDIRTFQKDVVVK